MSSCRSLMFDKSPVFSPTLVSPTSVSLDASLNTTPSRRRKTNSAVITSTYAPLRKCPSDEITSTTSTQSPLPRLRPRSKIDSPPVPLTPVSRTHRPGLRPRSVISTPPYNDDTSSVQDDVEEESMAMDEAVMEVIEEEKEEEKQQQEAQQQQLPAVVNKVTPKPHELKKEVIDLASDELDENHAYRCVRRQSKR